MESALWGLIGTIVGTLASIGTTWLSTRSSHKLQSEKAREERAERASAFQRQTLLDLQEAIHDALRLIHRAYLEDSEAHRTTKEWGKSNLSDEVNEGVRLAQRKVAILVERVSDDGVRTDVKALMSNTAYTLLARSEGEARLSLEKTSGDATQALEKIGTTLRKHY